MKSKDIYGLFEGKETLLEVVMKPGTLKKQALSIEGVRVGIEFEMSLPGDDFYAYDEPDFGYDESAESIDDIIEFFEYDNNDDDAISELRERLESNFAEWKRFNIYRFWEEDGLEFYLDWAKTNLEYDEVADYLGKDKDLFGERVPTTSEWETFAKETYNNPEYKKFTERALKDFTKIKLPLIGDEEEWLDDARLNYMERVWNEYNDIIQWPYLTTSDEPNLEKVAEEFGNYIGKPVNYSDRYHGATRLDDGYTIEPDPSISGYGLGLEFISHPMSVEEMVKDVEKIKRFADVYGASTNSSTGLHINISHPSYSKKNLDYVKLALLMGDEYVLDRFDRAYNTYTAPAINQIKKNVERLSPERIEQLLDHIKTGVSELAGAAIHDGYTDKYTSINTKSGYIEFRSAGNDWLEDYYYEIEPTIYRLVVALDAAVDPEKYKKEYSAQLYKLLKPDTTKPGNKGMLYFAEFMAGKMSKSELADKLYTARRQRLSKKGIIAKTIETADEGDWVVSHGGDKEYLMRTPEVDTQAKAKAAGKQLNPSWDLGSITVAQMSFPEVEGMKTFEVNGDYVWGEWIVAKNATEAMEIAKKYSARYAIEHRDNKLTATEVDDRNTTKRLMAARLRAQTKKIHEMNQIIENPNKMWSVSKAGLFVTSYEQRNFVSSSLEEARELLLSLDPIYNYIDPDLVFEQVISQSAAENYKIRMESEIKKINRAKEAAQERQAARDTLAKTTGIKLYIGIEDDNDSGVTYGRNEEEAAAIYRYLNGYTVTLVEFNLNNIGAIPEKALNAYNGVRTLRRAMLMSDSEVKSNYESNISIVIDKGYLKKQEPGPVPQPAVSSEGNPGFKVGDRVRNIHQGHPHYGEIGTITRLHKSNASLNYDNSSIPAMDPYKWLEPVTDEPAKQPRPRISDLKSYMASLPNVRYPWVTTATSEEEAKQKLKQEYPDLDVDNIKIKQA